MAKKETQQQRLKRVKAFLKTRPGVPLHFGDIRHATGVPKSQVDYKGMLSADPEIERTEEMFYASGKMRTFWAYTGKPGPLRDLKAPTNKFTKWVPWNERDELFFDEDDIHAGIYMFACFTDEDPSPERMRATTEKVPRQVIYVGMSKNLNNRPLTTHNRPDRYREIYDDPDLEALYVCILPVFPISDPDRSLFYYLIQLLEMQVQFRYVELYRTPPILHYKEHRDKKR